MAYSSMDLMIAKMNNYIGVMGIIGIVLAFALGFAVFLFEYISLAGKRSSGNHSSNALKQETEEGINASQGAGDDGVYQERSDGNPEVIIVGAGVAGSALACCLGKVKKLISFASLHT